jgi:hypothetical protein
MNRYSFLNSLIDTWQQLRYMTAGLISEETPPPPRGPTPPLCTVEQARARLRLDDDFNTVDIDLAIAGASEAVMAYLKRAENYTDVDPAPPQVVNAVLVLTGTFLRDPDGVEANDKWEQGYLPHAITAILYPLRDPAME